MAVFNVAAFRPLEGLQREDRQFARLSQGDAAVRRFTRPCFYPGETNTSPPKRASRVLGNRVGTRHGKLRAPGPASTSLATDLYLAWKHITGRTLGDSMTTAMVEWFCFPAGARCNNLPSSVAPIPDSRETTRCRRND